MGAYDDRQNENVIPFVVREHLEKIGLEHARRVHEEPAGRVNDF
jgi:hypothetical protein